MCIFIGNSIDIIMKTVEDLINFLEEHPDITDSKEQYAEDLFSLPKKVKNDVLELLELGAFGNLEHIVKLAETCRNEKIKINRLNENMIKAYCKLDMSAEDIVHEIHRKDMERLTPTYYEAPCKISNSDAINKLKGNK